ncbi:MAG: acyl-CoA dehydratase activase [Spirochaetia bacterium]
MRETLSTLVEELGPVPLAGIGFTSASPLLMRGAVSFDTQVSLIAACRRHSPDVKSIIFVGGERFGLIRFDREGNYRGARTNSSCAAGTGSFLDQQARRLGFAGIEELVHRAMACSTPAPRISTRCAVFARTDLVHAQQAGFSLEEICDGLCRGLAQNIADTLLGGEQLELPAVFAGGVALNQAVKGHLEQIIGVPLVTHADAPIMAAIGAALCRARQLLDAQSAASRDEPCVLGPDLVAGSAQGERQYFFEPLQMDDSTDSRNGVKKFDFAGGRFSASHRVEAEVYKSVAPGAELSARMGIDIGSTSTKAILIDAGAEPVAGFYTRTLGSPLTAVQAICEAVEDWRAHEGVSLRLLGVGATGAGRKFIGSLIKADLVVDEITAHARAAYSLDPAIDTIIEIGGQDAKFTTMRDGMVTFSHMNTVCAAGTGSFLEEQAERLGCSLADYERRVRGVRAPLSSDRCAVFMERDINNFLAGGFSTEEILAAALYSVRENYLQKVARGASFGERVAFQGATARNKALVAAFREGLGKPILVSRYCHLTGALGAALLLSEEGGVDSRFIGFAALRNEIPVRSETCALCGNHCRLRIATVAGETVAYGFLCGRDYGVKKFVEKDKSGFDLLRERRRAFAWAKGVQPGLRRPARPAVRPGTTSNPVVGIPAALGLYGQLPLWKRFFSLLDVPIVASEGFEAGIELGREVQGSEFCAPLAALHGHVKHLRDKADWIFLPVLLEESKPGSVEPRLYCYYTQFSSALASGAVDARLRQRCLMPQVSWTKWRERSKKELYQALAAAGCAGLTQSRVSRAFEQASAEYEAGVRALQRRFREETRGCAEPSVVLLGRPYNVLSPEMTKGIPGIFGTLGVKTFFQDMVPYGPADVKRIAPLLDMVHWVHAAKILEVACVVADTPNLYPVFITSFKCSPDSFALEYFKRILDDKGKPYLILQLDDHDSTLGYETRIEAGVASFRNHQKRMRAASEAAARRASPQRAAKAHALPIVPTAITKLGKRTLLCPNWDPLVMPLLAANLRREGVDTRLLPEDPVSIRKSMRLNTGQCLPLSIIAQEAMDFVRATGMDPARTALWLPHANISYNLGMFVPLLKSLMQAEGGGMERLEIYAGDIFYTEIAPRAAINAYKAYLAGGLLKRVGCRLRPYEKVPGATNAALAQAVELLIPAFEGAASKRDAIRNAAGLFDSVEISGERSPRVAIFGDLYARDNDVLNQGLITAIEQAGGEAVTTPFTEYIRIISKPYFRRWTMAGDHRLVLTYRTLWILANALGGWCKGPFERFLDPEPEVMDDGSEQFLREFGIRTEHAGESFDNLLKVFHLARVHPELALFVQASPGFCCPSMVTEAMSRDIERLTGVPVVSITYDGTGQYMNEVIVPYVKFAKGARARPGFSDARAEERIPDPART